MAYIKTEWVNNSTKVNATNMNKIENGIEAAHNDIATVSEDVANVDERVESLENTSIVYADTNNGEIVITVETTV